MSEFGWLTDLMSAEWATPKGSGVAVGVMDRTDADGCPAPSLDGAPHLPPSPHPHDGHDGNDAARLDNLAEHVAERAAIFEYDGELSRVRADLTALREVQCSTCALWVADTLGNGGIGTCVIGADASSRSAFDWRPVSAWANAPRFCAKWKESGDA